MTATKLDFNIRKDKSHSKTVVMGRKRETEGRGGEVVIIATRVFWTIAVV